MIPGCPDPCHFETLKKLKQRVSSSSWMSICYGQESFCDDYTVVLGKITIDKRSPVDYTNKLFKEDNNTLPSRIRLRSLLQIFGFFFSDNKALLVGEDAPKVLESSRKLRKIHLKSKIFISFGVFFLPVEMIVLACHSNKTFLCNFTA